MRDWDLLKNCSGDQCPKLAIPESLPTSDSCPCPLLPVSLWLSCLPLAPRRLTCRHLLPSVKHWLCHVVCLASGLQQQLGLSPAGLADTADLLLHHRYAMKCLDKKRIKMKQGETLALNERIMLSLVSTGVSWVAKRASVVTSDPSLGQPSLTHLPLHPRTAPSSCACHMHSTHQTSSASSWTS